MLRFTLLAVVALVGPGCSSETEETPSGSAGAGGGAGAGGQGGLGGQGGGGQSCSQLADACLENQKVCVEDADGARCEACETGHFANADGACEAIAGEVLEKQWADFTIGPGEELLGLCQSWTLNNPEPIFVNAVELEQNEQSHHSNWLWVPDNLYPGEDGVWPCADRGYSQLQAGLSGGVLYAQSTQATREVQKFPDGLVTRLPPYTRIVGDVHLLNTTPDEATGNVTMRIYGIPQDEVVTQLVPYHLTYDTLAIPPHSTARFYGECDIATNHQKVLGRPIDMKVHYLLPHTHRLGTRFFAEVLGGPNDGETILDVRGFNGEARGRFFETPIDLTGSMGFRFGCEWENPDDRVVEWGFGDDEMCECLGYTAGDLIFEARVNTIESDGTDGEIQVFTGACDNISIQYDKNNPGGPGPG